MLRSSRSVLWFGNRLPVIFRLECARDPPVTCKLTQCHCLAPMVLLTFADAITLLDECPDNQKLLNELVVSMPAIVKASCVLHRLISKSQLIHVATVTKRKRRPMLKTRCWPGCRSAWIDNRQQGYSRHDGDAPSQQAARVDFRQGVCAISRWRRTSSNLDGGDDSGGYLLH